MDTKHNGIYKITFPTFKKLRFINTSKEGIAKSRVSDGELVLNLYYWKKLKLEHKFFILAHEEGHQLYNTRDEMEADDHAFKKCVAAGIKLSVAVKALGEHLDRNNPIHIARTWVLYQTALKYDYQINKDKNSFRSHYDSANDIKLKLEKNGILRP